MKTRMSNSRDTHPRYMRERQKLKEVTYRLHDGFLEHIHSPCFQGNSKSLTVLTLLKTALKHSIDNCFQPAINSHRIVRILKIVNFESCIMVDAFCCKNKTNVTIIMIHSKTLDKASCCFKKYTFSY